MKIVTKVPARLSIFGGGTDVDPYASNYGGIVINLAINKYQKYLLKQNIGFIYSDSTFDGLSASGLGTSGSFFVAFLATQAKANGIKFKKEELAHKAWELECNLIGKYTGKQDQYVSVYGGLNIIEFRRDKVKIDRLPKNITEKLASWIILLHTGIYRTSRKLQEGMINLSSQQKKNLDKIKNIAINVIDPLLAGNMEIVGQRLNDTWEYKKKSNKGITTDKIDKLYKLGMDNGALGGKLLGSGGGGYMIFMCPPEKQGTLKKALQSNVVIVDFKPDYKGVVIK